MARTSDETGAAGRPMRYRRFAPLGRELSVLALGTDVYRTAGDHAPTDLLDAWLELGGNVIDTGREYGDSERVLGRWLRRSGRRGDVVLLTKGAHPAAGRPRMTPAELTADLLESLDTLGVASVEIYMLHRDDPAQPVEPLLETLNEHLRAGLIGAFGASNWSTARLEEANAYAREHGLEGFSCSSPALSLAPPREPPYPGCVSAHDDASRAWYERTQLPVFAWSAQAGGFFAGRDRAAATRAYRTEPNRERLRRARTLGARRGRAANEVALAWALAQPFPVHAIVGPRSVDELRGCVAALDVELTAAERRWLNLEGDAPGAADRDVRAAGAD